MLSVVEQRAGLWGALTAGVSAAATQQVPTTDDQQGVLLATGVDASLLGNQSSPVDSTSYDLPSVSTPLCDLHSSV